MPEIKTPRAYESEDYLSDSFRYNDTSRILAIQLFEISSLLREILENMPEKTEVKFMPGSSLKPK
jgi:hypothetical protein